MTRPLPEQTDVLVVGGGAVGLCAAWALRAAGREVTVVAREPTAVGASAGNAGMIVPSHVVPLSAPGVIAKGLRWLTNPESPFYIQPRADLDLLRWLWQFRAHATAAHVRRAVPVLRDLSLASAHAFAALQDAIGDIGYAQTGLLMLTHSAKGRAENESAAALAEAAGLRVERLDEAALRAREPGLRTPADHAVLYHDDGRADPDALLARLADALGPSAVRTGVEVLGFDSDGRRVTAVRTDRGAIRAAEVVLATGAWTPALSRALGLRLPVQPAKGYSLTVPAPPDGPALPMILTEEKITVTPMPGRLRFAGTLALSGLDDSVDARRLAPIRRLAAAYAPEAEVAAAVPWSGFRPCSPDGLPIVGRSPRHANVTVATGHGMMGLTLAPVTGALVAALLGGPPPPVPLAPFRAERFR
jgi:D-amino-acid dehydrogenase